MFENPLLNCTLFGGLLFAAAGVITFLFPPQKINSLYGYRTTSSMKNQESWTFSQRYAAKEMIKLGLILVACSSLSLITNFTNETNLIIGLALAILLVLTLFIRVEKAIKRQCMH